MQKCVCFSVVPVSLLREVTPEVVLLRGLEGVLGQVLAQSLRKIIDDIVLQSESGFRLIR